MVFADWVLVALLSSALAGFGIVIDKLLLTRYTKDWIYLAAFLGVINFAPLLFFPLFISPVAPLSTVLFGISAGVFSRIAIFFYMKAISLEEASRVVPLWLASPFFVLVMARIFLNERLLPIHYAGFLAVIFGGMIIMTTKAKGLLRLRPAFYIMMLSNLAYSFSEIIIKYSSLSSDFLQLIFWLFVGSSLASVPVLLFKRQKKRVLFCRKKGLLPLLLVGVLLSVVFVSLYYYAISLGPVSLVATLGSTDGVFVFIYGIFFTIFAPSILKESIDRKTLLTKAVAIAIIIAGVFLINGGV